MMQTSVLRARKTMSFVLARQITLHPSVGCYPYAQDCDDADWNSTVTFYREKYSLQRAPVFLVFYVFTAGIMHVTSREYSIIIYI